MSQFKSIRILSVLGASEWMRLKFFYLIIFVSILFIGFSHLLSSLSFAVQERLLFDFGLAGLEIGLVLISSLIGTHAIQREIDRKTLLVILARPIPRWHIVMGAWGSLLILNLVFTFGFTLAFVVSTGSLKLLPGFLLAAGSSLLKALVISSFALAIGVMVRPILALGMAICYWIFCYSLPDIKFFVQKTNDSFLIKLVDAVNEIIPKFYLFNWKNYYSVMNNPTFNEYIWAILHSFAWILFWLFAASYFFRRKEIV
ncbi:MAG: ABC transporter permease subunit [Bdellovibrio sp.]|nr:ABC transporter permease subunit [Bdellovibrio sp.]